MRKILQVFILVCCACTGSAQQKKIDSLLNVLRTVKQDTQRIKVLCDLADKMVFSKADTSQVLLEQALELAKKSEWPYGLARTQHGMGGLYIRMNDNKKAMQHYQEALKGWNTLLKENEREKRRALAGKAKTIGNMAIVESNMGRLQRSDELYLEAYKMDEALGNKEGMIRHMLNLAHNYKYTGDYKKELESYLQIKPIVDSIGDLQKFVLLYDNIGNAYASLGNLEAAKKAYQNALQRAEKDRDQYFISNELNSLGSIYSRQADYVSSLDHYLNALKIKEEIGDNDGATILLINIGTVYNMQSLYDKALGYYEKALKEDETIQNKMRMASTLSNMSIAFKGLKQHQKALDHLKRAMKINEEIGSKDGLANNHSNMAALYFADKDYKNAIDYFGRALKMYYETGDMVGIAGSTGNLGKMYALSGQYAQGDKYLQRGIELCDSLQLTRECAEFENISSMADSARGNFKSAYLHYKRHIQLLEKLKNDEIIRKQTQLEMQYTFDKKEAEAKADQRRKDELAIQEKRKQAIIRNALLAGMVLLLVIAILIARGFLQKKKANEIISRQKEEVEKQKALVETKQKEIIDSIRYAKRIQQAQLPTPKRVSNMIARAGAEHTKK